MPTTYLSLKSTIFHGHEKEKGDCSEGGGGETEQDCKEKGQRET